MHMFLSLHTFKILHTHNKVYILHTYVVTKQTPCCVRTNCQEYQFKYDKKMYIHTYGQREMHCQMLLSHGVLTNLLSVAGLLMMTSTSSTLRLKFGCKATDNKHTYIYTYSAIFGWR